MAFSFEKFQRGIKNGPAGSFERKEERELPFDVLISKFARQAVGDLDRLNWETEFVNEITRHVEDLVGGKGAETVAEEIARHHDTMLKHEKGIDDRSSQVAYILALALEIQNRRNKAH